MSKQQPFRLTPRCDAAQKPAESAAANAGPHHLPSSAAIRETIESVAIAFMLAFLFRTFEAEAFVIPTGSMAPTLMGRHKDLACPECGNPYQVSASEEVDSSNGALRSRGYRTIAGTCPMCRYAASLEDEPSYNGDRILVSKLAYQWSDPRRWDVFVFKFPGDATGDARTNYIKRLVGLPGETVRIQHGDLWIRRGQEGEFRIARKPPEKLLAMLQPVFDNDYMPQIAKDGWPVRWQAELAADGGTAGMWSSDDDTTFQCDGAADGERWLRYRHLTPSFSQWLAAEGRRDGSAPHVEPQWITDFTAYDTNNEPSKGFIPSRKPRPDSLGEYWVGDLALQCAVELESSEGALIFELRKGGRQFQCRIDAATGQAALSISGRDMAKFQPKAATAVRGPGRHQIRFSNCDNELRLWVDGDTVEFDSLTTYDNLNNTLPDESDLAPVGIASAGAKVRLSRLALFRDLYYIAKALQGPPSESHHQGPQNADEGYADYVLNAEEFFALGDNSARSKDSRYWGAVARELLIGKAMFIYWPHSWNKVPYVNVPFPFFPNFARMGFVR